MQDDNKNILHESQADYKGFVHKSEDEKLLADVLRPPIEKLQLFTKMLRRNATLNQAKILNNHK